MVLSDGERQRIYEEEIIREKARNEANSRSRSQRKIVAAWLFGTLSFIVIARSLSNLSEDIYFWFFVTTPALIILGFVMTFREAKHMRPPNEDGHDTR